MGVDGLLDAIALVERQKTVYLQGIFVIILIKQSKTNKKF